MGGEFASFAIGFLMAAIPFMAGYWIGTRRQKAESCGQPDGGSAEVAMDETVAMASPYDTSPNKGSDIPGLTDAQTVPAHAWPSPTAEKGSK